MYPAKKQFFLCVLIAAALLVSAARPQTAHAQAGSAYDLIDAVNAVRASYGLDPYTIDSGLMALAQAHSDYQASIGDITHEFADGSSPADHGVIENIGGGMNAGVSVVVNNQWTDYWHQNTMTGYTSGSVGAGVAEADGVVYYTLDVRHTGSATNLQPTAGPTRAPSAPGTPQASQEAEVVVETAEPSEDGAVVHTVQTGQTLWSIATAYDTTVDVLVAQNGLDVEDPVIYAGQVLLVKAGFTATPTATITETPGPPTKTVRPTATRRATRTPFITPTPTATTFLSGVQAVTTSSPRSRAIFITLGAGLGLLVLVSLLMRDKPPK